MDRAATRTDGNNNKISTEEVCRREPDNYLDYNWRPVTYEQSVSIDKWLQIRKYLPPRVANLAWRWLATKHQGHALKGVFSKQV